jgi:DNA-binding PadR family transcriptional regulator
MGITNQPPDLLPGTLDLLILRTLTRGAQHGYGIADRIRLLSADVLQVGESSLYPALQRPAAQRLGQRGMGRLREQPARALLHHHRRGQKSG